MKRLIPLLLVAPLLTALPARAENGAKVRVGDLVQGRRLFQVHCTSCHGPQGLGDGAVKTVPAAPNLIDPARMNLMGDAQVYELVRKGGPALGRAQTMPAFGDALSPLEMWDLVSYLRSQHLEVTDFYPDAGSYFGDVYTIDKWGAQRHQDLTGKPLTEDARTYTVLGVYKGTPGPQGPHRIPNTPLAVSRIDRKAKVGYIVFVDGELPGIPGRHVLGIQMDNSGLIWDVQANVQDPALRKRIEDALAQYEGYGRKGLKEPFGRSKLDRAWTAIYSRGMEAVVMFDKAERERHWADSEFGGAADPEVSVEGGNLEIVNDKKKKK